MSSDSVLMISPYSAPSHPLFDTPDSLSIICHPLFDTPDPLLTVWGLLCIHESENLASNSSFWDKGNAVLILGLKQTRILMRKLHVRLALMLTVTFECLKTEFCRRSTWSGWKTGTFNSRVLLSLFILSPAWQDYFTPCGRFGRLLVASLQITNVLLIKKYPPSKQKCFINLTKTWNIVDS